MEAPRQGVARQPGQGDAQPGPHGPAVAPSHERVGAGARDIAPQPALRAEWPPLSLRLLLQLRRGRQEGGGACGRRDRWPPRRGGPASSLSGRALTPSTTLAAPPWPWAGGATGKPLDCLTLRSLWGWRGGTYRLGSLVFQHHWPPAARTHTCFPKLRSTDTAQGRACFTSCEGERRGRGRPHDFAMGASGRLRQGPSTTNAGRALPSDHHPTALAAKNGPHH